MPDQELIHPDEIKRLAKIKAAETRKKNGYQRTSPIKDRQFCKRGHPMTGPEAEVSVAHARFFSRPRNEWIEYDYLTCKVCNRLRSKRTSRVAMRDRRERKAPSKK